MCRQYVHTRDARLLRQLKYLMSKLLTQTEEPPPPRYEQCVNTMSIHPDVCARPALLYPQQLLMCVRLFSQMLPPLTFPMHTCSDPFGLGADVVSTDANREDSQHDHELAEAVGRCIIEHTAAR